MGVSPSGKLTPVDVADPKLDAPAHPVEADFVAHTRDGDVLHIECQGYRDATFEERLVRYHLALAARFWPRRVRTVAIWLSVPPRRQRRGLRHGDIIVRVAPVVLPELRAEHVLQTPEAACFAAAADRGSWSEEELARRVVAALIATGASPRRRYMAAVAALMRSAYRFDRLAEAAKEQHMEPIMIEDLVKFGEDLGLEAGRAQGKAEGKAEDVLAILAARGLPIPDVVRARVLGCSDLATLDAWIRRAVVVPTATELVGSP